MSLNSGELPVGEDIVDLSAKTATDFLKDMEKEGNSGIAYVASVASRASRRAASVENRPSPTVSV